METTVAFDTQRIQTLVQNQRAYFRSGATLSESFRRTQLETLEKLVVTHEEEIIEALARDLGKPRYEAFATEIGTVLAEIRHARGKLSQWMRPKRVSTPMLHFPGSSYIYPDPYGVVLIIAPWNYPFNLVFSPLVGALAAGNTAIIKPSEAAAHTSALIAKLIARYFKPELVQVVEGAVEETQTLLAQKFDYIFFTGGTAVGKVVYEAAAKHLTPVTLELGGKNPCIIDENIHLEIATRRIVWGKLVNCGQTCLAPDYLFVHKNVYEAFMKALTNQIQNFYGKTALQSPDYGKIINKRHYERLKSYLANGDVYFGGGFDDTLLKIEPTLLVNVSLDSPIMQEEIFGPILPVFTYTDVNEVIRFVNERPKPLAAYVFSTNKALAKDVFLRTSSGGGAINETVMHIATSHLPFGGVGDSGIGGYHGKYSFDTFSHQKSVLDRANLLDIKLRYAPYSEGNLAKLKMLMRRFL